MSTQSYLLNTTTLLSAAIKYARIKRTPDTSETTIIRVKALDVAEAQLLAAAIEYENALIHFNDDRPATPFVEETPPDVQVRFE